MLGPDFSHLIQQIALMAVPVVLAITLHEVAHGWVADRLGDSTARLQGRLTLNPLAHVDPFGTLLIPILLYATTGFVIGYAKPVPVNFNNLRRPKRDMVWVAAAGPGTNLILAFVFGILFQLMVMFQPEMITHGFSQEGGQIGSFVLVPLTLMFIEGIKWNVLLCVFNLIPIPPLDGGRILVGILPPSQSETLSRIEPFGFLIIMGLVFLNPLGFMSHLVAPAMGLLTRLFAGIPLF
ncbi:MAG: site-2 protease family protein [Nitrospirae bacterium]|nr:site-2 protease family protein [Nitrospirota bacterium]